MAKANRKAKTRKSAAKQITISEDAHKRALDACDGLEIAADGLKDYSCRMIGTFWEDNGDSDLLMFPELLAARIEKLVQDVYTALGEPAGPAVKAEVSHG
jgi:hypothetical protein